MTLDSDALASSLLSAGAVLAGLAVGAMLLARRAGDRRAQRWLGALVLLTAATFGNALMCEVGACTANNALYFLPLDFSLAVGPLVYLYVRERLRPGLMRRDAWHAALPLAQVAFWTSVGFRSVAFKAWLWESVVHPVVSPLVSVLFVATTTGYAVAALRLARAPAVGPAWTSARTAWLRRFLRTALILFAALTAYAVADIVLDTVAGVNPYNWPWYAFPKHVALTGVLAAFVVHGWEQMHPARWMPPPAAARVATYGLSPAALAAEAARVRATLAAERPHRNPDLTLGLLADALGLSDKVLSFVLNEGLGTSYAALVNGLRVDDARRALEDPALAHRSVLGIGLDAGFSSKATFNRAFKIATGRTPTEVRRAARPDDESRPVAGVSDRP